MLFIFSKIYFLANPGSICENFLIISFTNYGNPAFFRLY
jgi:hypothetical protein